MIAPTYAQLRAIRRRWHGPWFRREHDLNAIILRDEQLGTWGDLLCLAYVDGQGREQVVALPCSADASREEWLTPRHPDGCVYILDQHAPRAYRPGLHRGRPALEQVAPLAYVRWVPDGTVPEPSDLEALRLYSSFVGDRETNIHARVSAREPARPAHGDTEGCPLLRRLADMRVVLDLVELQRLSLGTDLLSVTFARVV